MNKIFLLLTFSLLIKSAPAVQAQTWSSAGLSYPGLVFALADYGGAVNGGGVFSIPEQVRAMAVYNGSLYSGGANIGGVTHVLSNGNIAGTISGGGPITSITVFNNELYVGGNFDSINGIPVYNIAKWNGSSWSAVGGGVGVTSAFVYSLGVYNNALYAGTNFGPCYKWDGSNWSSVGNFTSTVAGAALIRGFGVYNGELYVGGFFDHVNGSPMVNLARWNGTNWTGVGDIGVAGDPSDGLSALLEYSGSLYCAGNFSTAGGTSAENITRFSSGNFQALGSGTNGVVNALLVFNQSLYAAGSFTSAGGTTVSNVAKWTICTPPPATITYTGVPVLCNPGGSILLSANIGAGYTYQWKLGSSEISGATASSYLVTTIGTYSVVVTNAGGCSATSSGVGIGANTVFASITPPGPIAVCSGTNALLTAYTSAGYTYQWKNNGTVIPGAILSSYNASAAGSYTVDETAGPCTKTSNPVTITVNPLPSAVISTGGATTFCSGDSVTLNATFGANKTYQWKKGGINISGAALSSYTTTAGGTYKVTVTNTVTGCSKTTAAGIVITVNPLPSATITPQGPTTFCAGGSVVLKANSGTSLTYQWKKGASNISGATAKNYTATTAGVYKVKVTNSNGCSKLSTGVTVTVPCRKNESVIMGDGENVFGAKVFPNPAHSEINIVLSSHDNFEIEIISTLGVRIIKTQNQNRIDISNLSNGIYFIKVFHDNNFFTQKFIKQ